MAETAIFETTRIETFAFDDMFGIYVADGVALAAIEIGETYKVIWDDIEYTCIGQDMSALGAGYVGLGNLSAFGGNGNDEPFAIGYVGGGLLFGSFETVTTHTVGIFAEIAAPNDVVIQNYSQKEVTYPSVPKVWLKSAESTEENTVLVPFSYGEAVENVPISLDFSSGEDQTVTADDGKLIKSAVIEKPVDLVAENIRRGKVIAGVEGDFIGDTEEIAVDGDNDLTFASGESFVVEPSSVDKVISKVTISPPSALIPENIAKGVNIAGIEGTHESSGGKAILDDDSWIDDIVFWDFDGTIIHQVKVDEAPNISSLPTPPNHDKLTFIGWNYTIEQIRTLNRPLDVGAMYATADGKTYLKLSVTNSKYLSVPIEFIQTVASGVTINWGDGKTSTSGSTVGSYTTLTHAYSSVGTYLVSISVAEGCSVTAGRGTSGYSFVGGNTTYYKNYLIDVYFGERIVPNSYCLYTCSYVERIVFPHGLSEIPQYCCASISSSPAVYMCWIIPDTVTSIAQNAFRGSFGGYFYYKTCAISIPESVISLGSSAFYSAYRLKRLIIPSGITALPYGIVYNSYDLRKVDLPYGLTTIGNSSFNRCDTLREVSLSENAVFGEITAFSNCNSLSKINIKSDDAITTIDLLKEDAVVSPSIYEIIKVIRVKARWLRVIITGNPTESMYPASSCYEFIFTGEPSASAVASQASGNYYSTIYVRDAIYDDCAAALSGSDYRNKLRKLSEYRGDLPKI